MVILYTFGTFSRICGSCSEMNGEIVSSLTRRTPGHTEVEIHALVFCRQCRRALRPQERIICSTSSTRTTTDPTYCSPSVLPYHRSFQPQSSVQHIRSSSTKIHQHRHLTYLTESSLPPKMSIYAEHLVLFVAWPHASPPLKTLQELDSTIGLRTSI